jgi:S-DNA-T family DNA segregation ATPase FtsK/SpoIIIE
MSGFVLRVVDGADVGRCVQVDSPLVVGREGDVVVRDPTVSRRHVRIEPHDDHLQLSDLRSASGTRLNGAQVSTGAAVAGDQIALGATAARVLRHFRFPDLDAGPSIVVEHAGRGRAVAVADGLVVGRDPSSDVRIDDPSVSRRHAVFRVSSRRVVLEDCGSANGTFVQGRRVVGSVDLSDGNEISFGGAGARAVYRGGEPSTGPVSIRAALEGSTRTATFRVDAAATATVAEVTAALAEALQAPDAGYLLYRTDDGCLFHPDDLWRSIGVRHGDELVLGEGDASGYEPGPARHRPTRAGGALNQLPRTVWPQPPFSVPRIDPPESTSFKGRGVVWQVAGGLGAVMIGLTLAVVNPSYAVFGLMTGAIGIVSIAASVLGEQSRRRHRLHEYRRRLAQLDVDLGDARSRQSAAAAALSPSIDDLEQWLRSSSPRIWERRPSDPDALTPTIGEGTRATTLVRDDRGSGDSPYTVELDDVVARHTRLDHVPITGPSPRTGSFGVTGPQDEVAGLLAHIVIEAAVLHPPTQLRIWVAATTREWEWCRWLPHVGADHLSTDPGSASALVSEAARTLSDTARGDGLLHLVVVPDWTRRTDLSFGVHPHHSALWVVGATDRRDLPSGLVSVLEIAPGGRAEVIGAYPDAPIGPVQVRGVDLARAGRLAVMLGRLAGPASASAPEGIVELLGVGSDASPDVVAAWRRAGGERLTVPVGSDDAGEPVTIGFRRDGPHGMVAGTTGSGKSELLQTMLAALVLCHRPDQLTLFLVDFKGGSTFAPLARLPHVVGLVTDIENDATLAARALTALDAEIGRRKRILEAARVPDVIAYERTEVGDAAPLPDLLVVIDEFALLVERQPEVRDRLDTIATQGRSLGIHLLLATQSPSGVITHAIRTNTNLWICLRVVADSESVEILGRRDAARIPDGSPGRAIIRLGAAEELRTFQAARVARPVGDDGATVRVTRVDGGPTAPTRQRFGGRTELDVVVERVCAAAGELAIAAARPLWLAPLPRELPASAVPRAHRSDRLVTVIGLADLPQQQVQEPYVVDLSASGHHLVTGVFGAGKTTTLRQIAVDLAGSYSPVEVHLYGLDAGAGSLGPLAALPHVGDVVGVSDVERFARLIDRLGSDIDRRRDALAVAGAGEFCRWREQGGSDPWIVLLVDDYPALREVAEREDNGRLLERFNSLLQNGPAVGVHLVIATTQAVDLRAREVNLVPSRLVLRSADPSDYALVDGRFSPNELPRFPPGRGLAPQATEVQVCLTSTEDISRVVERWSSPSIAPRPGWPRAVARLPVSVARRCLAPTDGLVLGVGGAEIEPVSVAGSPEGLALLVAGPRQSGRSTALSTLLRSIPSTHTLVLAPRPSPLREPHGDRVLVRTDTNDLDRELDEFIARAGRGSCLVIDDAETIASAPGLGPRMEQILRRAGESGVCVLVGVRVSDLPAMFDPWARYLVSLRHAVLLQPTPDDAFLFGVKLPRIPPPSTPGRGVIVDRDRVIVVQVATDGD